jgi:hypothetical protein
MLSLPRLPDADRSKTAEAAKQRDSRFPCKECTYMPGFLDHAGSRRARFNAPVRVAFHHANSVSTLNSFKDFAPQWLACGLPCQRFVSGLAVRYDDSGPAWLAIHLLLRTFTFYSLRSLPAH